MYDSDWSVPDPKGSGMLQPPWSAIREGSDLKSIWPATTFAEDDFDPLRRRAAHIISTPVFAVLLENSISQWGDSNLLYLPDVASDLAKASFPQGPGWSKREQREKQACLISVAVLPCLWFGALAVELQDSIEIKVSTWELGFYLCQLAWTLLLPTREESNNGWLSITQLVATRIWIYYIGAVRHDVAQLKNVFRNIFSDAVCYQRLMAETEASEVAREILRRFQG